jgi:ABC-2 type transport system permease protein
MINAATDGAAAAERQLTRLRHDPTAIALTVGAPVVLVVIFGYIFGSAIAVPGGGGTASSWWPACTRPPRRTCCRR